ncbi:MAG TPA: alcohol dehydrogenase catalytic domain-containing protein [Blastocatellia bacterium]|nr:alcohol dehydrogenase catalytic domain-containing protein [Blastocatellia bacterium]
MSEAMQAVVFHGPGRWALEEFPRPRIQAADDVLLRVDRVSICGTDIHILSDPPGHPATSGSILGHEYVATVTDIGDGVINVKPGDRVVIDPNITCGLCDYCRMGLTNVCENMTTLGIFRHGGLAEFNLAPAKALHKIDRDVPPERACLAEPLACVWHAFEKTNVVPGESVAILGAGPIGLLFLMLFKTAGAGRVFVIEPTDFRRQTAERLGADVINPKSEDAAAEVKAITRIGVDVAVDAAGSLLPEALNLVRRGGRVILFGVNQNAERSLNQYAITRYEASVIGSFIQRTAFPKVARILEAGTLQVEKLITHRLRLADVGDALEAMRVGEAIKAVIQP